MRELLRRGHDVGVFYPCNYPVPESQLIENGLDRLRIFRVNFVKTRGQVLLSAWKPHITRRFDRVVSGFGPDVIVFHHLVRLSLDLPALGRLKKIPQIYYLHDFYLACPSYSLLTAEGQVCGGGSLLRCARCLYTARYNAQDRVVSPFVLTALPFLLLRNSFIKKVLRDVDLFISPSKFLLRELDRQGVNCSPSVIIPYGSDGMHTVGKPTNRKEIRFGYLGNISKKKGIDVLVKAFQGRMAESLVIRGFSDSRAIEDFRKTFPSFGASLEMFDTNIEVFFNKVDVLVVPSVWYENQPNVIIESFAYGKPVVCSNVGGMAEMVRDGVDGLLFKPNDPYDLRRKIEYLLDNPDEVSRLSANAPRWPTVAEEVDRLLEAAENIGCGDAVHKLE